MLLLFFLQKITYFKINTTFPCILLGQKTLFNKDICLSNNLNQFKAI